MLVNRKAMEEKALEGQTPKKARFDESARCAGLPVGRKTEASFPSPISDKPLKSRRSRIRARPGNVRRGEAPKGVPRFGGSKALKGKSHGCCCD